MTSLTAINPSDAPRPVGGYSQAVGVTGASELLFVSGQIPETPDGAIPDEFPEQCRLAWANVTASLRAAGLGIEDLVKVTIYLTARSFAEVNRAIRVNGVPLAQPWPRGAANGRSGPASRPLEGARP